MIRVVAWVLAFCLSGVAGAEHPPWIARGAQAMVAADSPLASRAGVEVLRAGGNAIDAATAVSFASAVTRPYSTGLGGGGFLIARFANGRTVVIDFRETAPAAATREMFVEAQKAHPDRRFPSRYGHLAVAVPGLLAGRAEAHALFGKLPWAETLEHAIRLARDGFQVDDHYAETAEKIQRRFEQHAWLRKHGGAFIHRVHLNGGDTIRPGWTLRQPQLARLLERIAEHGPDFFYRGPVADAIEDQMTEHGGVMRAADLARYRTRRREPITGSYRDYTIISMPPASSGGVALIETLNILAPLDLPSVYRDDRGTAMHLLTEAMKHAFADRARWMGDTDFADVPIDLLTSGSYAQSLSSRIQHERTARPPKYGVAQLPADGGTSHFCIADAEGNVVVSTETINTEFGSLVAVDQWGLILNNEMDDFAAKPGEANAYGLIQSQRNAVAPGKRPLSSMSPTIVMKGDQPHLLLGASGGPRIISGVLNVLLNVIDFDMPLDQAVKTTRVHHQWRPDAVIFDQKPPDWLQAALTSKGHTIADVRKQAVVQCILRSRRGWLGASDPRKGGRPAGY